MRSLPETIAGWVHDGFSLIGQIRITSRPEGSFELRHREDVAVHGLEEFRGPSAARDLSFFDEARNYRSLKTAPNLRRGWSLIVETPEDLRLALDHFYPAMTALWRSQLEASLSSVPLRDTLDRQTGMYAASKRLQDEEGLQLVASACNSQTGCMKRMLWPFTKTVELTGFSRLERSADVLTLDSGEKEIPLLCHEACNILVAACRETVKKRERAAAATV
jgi:sirohydrochlorin cobaltochelatase